MWIWRSPNGVDHLMDDHGWCVTCGRGHVKHKCTIRLVDTPDIWMGTSPSWQVRCAQGDCLQTSYPQSRWEAAKNHAITHAFGRR